MHRRVLILLLGIAIALAGWILVRGLKAQRLRAELGEARA